MFLRIYIYFTMFFSFAVNELKKKKNYLTSMSKSRNDNFSINLLLESNVPKHTHTNKIK